ncbi:PD-(D/E)XK nuclease family protein [Myxacorys almedinensis A]|uniref:PD-(D/E)XK nuclease family protein n=2 Tax=Myxacorys TaxID=2056239 RepID=A0A8J7Z0U8_9CYAN|nr:PD-(D/E)XK nuclease family protein [Myxacorys almedinensis A]
MRLSQGQLNLLEVCPRKFQHTYLEQLSSPGDTEQQERLLAGSRFHLLMQQWEMGLPIAAMLREDEQLNRWFGAFVEAEPTILGTDAPADPSNPPFRQSEHLRILDVEGYLLTVIYDLLIGSEAQAQILDWKTYPKPGRAERLAQNWQSRLYPFVLVETSHYTPEQVSMIYWFFQSQGDAIEPQSLKLSYDRTKHEQTRRELTQLLDQLDGWLDRYERGEPFPQVPVAAEPCDRCSFAWRCQRVRDEAAIALPSLGAIAEIPL